MFIFYHEDDNTTSGAAVVIINLIRGLTNAGEVVLLINVEGGAIHLALNGVASKLLTVVDNDLNSVRNVAKKISEKDAIITFHYYTIYKYFKKVNPKIIFYCVNICSIPVANRYFNLINFRFLTRKLFVEASQRNGLLFMDRFTCEVAKKQLVVEHLWPKFLPVMVEVAPENLWLQRAGNLEERESFTISYVGRAVDWKIYPVRKLLKDLASNASTRRLITFHIITDNIRLFRRWIEDIEVPGLTFVFYENLTQGEMTSVLLNQVDLHFAMGTSALDGAKLGIPTVLLDFAFEDFPSNYKYRFLFNAIEFNLGSLIGEIKVAPGSTFILEELLAMLSCPVTRSQLSKKSYEYVSRFHDVRQVIQQLISYSEKSQMQLRLASKYLVRYWV